jgi:hypothetical protein
LQALTLYREAFVGLMVSDKLVSEKETFAGESDKASLYNRHQNATECKQQS